jgi:mRNA interferase MazF
VIVAPLTHTIKRYPCRENITFEGGQGQIMLDQMRAVDKIRLGEKIGKIDIAGALSILRIMFP